MRQSENTFLRSGRALNFPALPQTSRTEYFFLEMVSATGWQSTSLQTMANHTYFISDSFKRRIAGENDAGWMLKWVDMGQGNPHEESPLIHCFGLGVMF